MSQHESPHLTHEQIALLASGDPREVEGSVLDHLASCAACREAVRESATWLAAWTDRPEAFADSNNAGKASRRFLEQVGIAERHAGRRRSRVLLGASLAAVAAATLLIVHPYGNRTFSSAPVEAAIRETAFSGKILIPGAEDDATGAPGAYRSAVSPLSEAADSALHQLAQEYNRGSENVRLAETLVAGYLALGQIGSARDFVHDARKRFPRDATIEVLDGLVDYCDGRLPQAEEHLRSAVARAPKNEVARVNLARVLADTGRRAEAVSLARSVRESTTNPVVAACADSILTETHKRG